jgi:quercetin dioxygenase-like cupin family protein
MQTPPIVNLRDGELTPQVEGPIFAGNALSQAISEKIGTDQIYVTALFYEAGARVRPHTHVHDQILYYISGTGVIALDGGEDVVIAEGGFVSLPGGIVHMHGADESGPACHLALGPMPNPVDFPREVPESWSHWVVSD